MFQIYGRGIVATLRRCSAQGSKVCLGSGSSRSLGAEKRLVCGLKPGYLASVDVAQAVKLVAQAFQLTDDSRRACLRGGAGCHGRGGRRLRPVTFRPGPVRLGIRC